MTAASLAFAAVVLTILAVHVYLGRDAARPVAAPAEPVERGTDHNDATAEEVLAVFDELAAQAYPRITVLEDDTEIPLALPAVRPVRVRHGAVWPAAPVRPLVLIRWPVTL